jgi:shikimate kinase
VSVGDRHVVLVGGMAVGKTTVGRALAEALGRPLRDSDADLEASRGEAGRAVAAEEGVGELHRWEAEHLLSALASPEPVVVAAAASVVDDERTLGVLAETFVVWLRARPGTAAARLDPADHRRRLGADPADDLADLNARRAPRYGSVADLTVDVDGLTPGAVVDTVLAALADTPAERRARRREP